MSWSPPRRAFYSVADASFFPGVVALLNSARIVGHLEPFVILDRGLDPAQRAILERVAVVVSPDRVGGHGHLCDVDAPWRFPAIEALALLDADVILTRPLDELLDHAATGSVVAFADDQPDRFHPEWATAQGLACVHRHTYVNAGCLVLPGGLATGLLERVGELYEVADFSHSRGIGEGSMADAFRLPNQDCWNAALAALVDPSRLVVLDHAMAPFQPWEPVDVEDARTLRCRLPDGRRPFLLHHIGRKPWLTGTPPSAYSSLLPRVLHAEDAALRLQASAPLVSVIVPTHQRCEAVCRAVRSAIAQTYRDFEVIVVDDGSRDGTESELTKLGGPVRYIWQRNRGVSAARNAGVAVARGELIAFLDADDQWHPDHLAAIVAMMRGHPQAVLASTSRGYREGGRASPLRAELVEAFPAILTRALAGFVSSTAVVRAELEAAGGFDEGLSVCEDTDLWLRLALRGPFVLLRRRTAEIGHSEGSLSSSARAAGTRMAAYSRSLTRVADDLEAARDDAAAAQVRAALQFQQALLGVDRVERSELQSRLSAACSTLPDLLDEWGLAVWILRELGATRSPASMIAHLGALEAAWPAPGTPTGLAVQGYAALIALRARHFAAAAALLHRILTGGWRSATTRRTIARSVRARAAGALGRKPPIPGRSPERA